MLLTARGVDPIGKEILFINFNQDQTCIAIGTRHGYRLYNCEPFGKCYSKDDGGYAIVEMLFCTSLVALVGIGDQPSLSPRRLQIVNTKRQSTICELTFPRSILAVRLNRKRLVVVLEEQTYIYDISNMKLLHTIETHPNPSAICALSPSSERCYLVYATRRASHSYSHSASASSVPQEPVGDMTIFDALSLQPVNYIQAHKSALACIMFNIDGNLLATASDKGTIIRVFSVPDGTKLYQFRRGTHPAQIFSLSFNATSTLLCASSDTETVHIFRLAKTQSSNKSVDSDHSSATNADMLIESARRPQSLGSRIRKTSQTVGRSMAGAMGGYLPNTITEIFEPARDFASIKLPSHNARSVVALSSSQPHVLVVTSEGYAYQYGIDMELGGDGTFLRQFSLMDNI